MSEILCNFSLFLQFLLKEALNFIGQGDEDAESSNASKSSRSARPQHHSTRHSGGNQNLVAELKEAKQKEDRGWWFQFLDLPSNDVTYGHHYVFVFDYFFRAKFNQRNK